MSPLLGDLRQYQRYCYPHLPVWISTIRCLFAHPAILGVMWFRFGRMAWSLRIPGLRHLLLLAYNLLLPFVRLVSGVQVLPQTRVGPGLAILHFGPNIIHPNSVLEGNCIIHHNVTLAADSDHSAPYVGANVQIGTGAVLFGGISIGNDTMIGAGAVVTKSMPPWCIAGGVPAKVIRSRLNESESDSSSS